MFLGVMYKIGLLNLVLNFEVQSNLGTKTEGFTILGDTVTTCFRTGQKSGGELGEKADDSRAEPMNCQE